MLAAADGCNLVGVAADGVDDADPVLWSLPVALDDGMPVVGEILFGTVSAMRLSAAGQAFRYPALVGTCSLAPSAPPLSEGLANGRFWPVGLMWGRGKHAKTSSTASTASALGFAASDLPGNASNGGISGRLATCPE